jgi:hypothetical protein
MTNKNPSPAWEACGWGEGTHSQVHTLLADLSSIVKKRLKSKRGCATVGSCIPVLTAVAPLQVDIANAIVVAQNGSGEELVLLEIGCVLSMKFVLTRR